MEELAKAINRLWYMDDIKLLAKKIEKNGKP